MADSRLRRQRTSTAWTVDGWRAGDVFPTRRRIYRPNADRTADKSEATIILDLDLDLGLDSVTLA